MSKYSILIPKHSRSKVAEIHLQNGDCCGNVLENWVFERWYLLIEKSNWKSVSSFLS